MNTYLSSLREQEVRIPCRNATLLGNLSIPNGAKGLVIFAHGTGSSRFSPRNRMVADEMHHHKLATLLFDLLTIEDSATERTDDLRFDIPFLTKRLIDVTRWAQQEDSLDELNIGYFGASTGAAATLTAAARIPEIRAIVSRGGRTDLAGDAVDWVDAPTLLLAGELDLPVINWNRETYHRLSCEKNITLIPGASHLFTETGALEQVAQLAASWFECYLPLKRHN